MKIAYSAASPYVRKVMACAIARGLNDKIERWKIGTTDPALLPVNPLSKVPTLITDDGMSLYDSPVICEYLDSIGSAPKLFPPVGPARWKALTPGSAGRRHPRRHPAAPPRDRRCRRTRAARATSRSSRARSRARSTSWRRRPIRWATLTTIGEITIGCALGYLDFRYANEPWRPGHPKLEAWYDKVVKLPPLAETMPVG